MIWFGGQSLHNACPSPEYLPRGHGSHEELAGVKLYFPFGHLAHVKALVLVCGTPGSHTSWFCVRITFVSRPNCPRGQQKQAEANAHSPKLFFVGAFCKILVSTAIVQVPTCLVSSLGSTYQLNFPIPHFSQTVAPPGVCFPTGHVMHFC